MARERGSKMEIQTIEMSVEQARDKLAAYESVLHATSDPEIAAAIEGYRELAKGRKLVDIQQVFRDCPVDDIGRPRLALARADRASVRLSWGIRSSWCHFLTNADLHFNSSFPELIRSIQMDRQHEYCTIKPWHPADTGATPEELTGYALVPMVPPDVLRARSMRRKRWVLWEVEEWSDSRLTPEPDTDPYLLRYVGGTVYVVVGEWDLTDLERAIMRGRQ